MAAVTSRAWAQTASGRAFDLLDPSPDAVNFDTDVAEQLARNGRFAGAVGAGIYSVAQHCCIGADYLMGSTRDPLIAAAFLLHDAHEAWINDIPTPAVDALIAIARREFESKPEYDAGYIVKSAVKSLKRGIDVAVYRAAGLPWPLDAEVARLVAETDLRMLATERRHLLARAPRPWDPAIEAADPLRLSADKFRIWPWPVAADEYRARLARWCPAALGFPRRGSSGGFATRRAHKARAGELQS